MRGVMPREQQQEHHRHHFLALDLSALLFDPHKFSDETVTAILPRGFELPLQIALHRQDIRDPAEEGRVMGAWLRTKQPDRYISPLGRPEQRRRCMGFVSEPRIRGDTNSCRHSQPWPRVMS